MKIAIYHNLPSGGAKRHTFEQVRELARRGYELTEYVPETADTDFCDLRPYVRAQVVFEGNPIRIFEGRIPFATPYLHTIQGLAKLRRTREVDSIIAKDVAKKGFDIAFVKDCRAIANPYVLRFLSIPSLYQCHHGLRHRLEQNDQGSYMKSSLVSRVKNAYYLPARRLFESQFRRDETTNIRAANRVITNSEFSRGLIAAEYGLESQVIYPGVDTRKFQPTGSRNGAYVLSVGALVRSKGHGFILSALARIDASRRPPLVVAATYVEPAEKQFIQREAERLGVQLRLEQVRSDSRMVRLYSGALAFVYAPYQEALGIAALEAMACGCPVIAVREGGIQETVVDGVTGFLVPRDPAAFASRLEDFLNDKKTRDRLGEAGILHVRQAWTWPKAVDRLEEQFRLLQAENAHMDDAARSTTNHGTERVHQPQH